MIFISKNLEYLRKKAGFKQGELSEKLGVKANTISNYEKGVSHPDYTILEQMIKVFKVSADHLLYQDLTLYDNESRILIPEAVSYSLIDKFMNKLDQSEKTIVRQAEEIGKLKERVLQMEAVDNIEKFIEKPFTGSSKQKTYPADSANVLLK